MRYLFFALLMASCTLTTAQNFNLELVSNVTYETDGNDIWGFVDKNGVEYAIVGSQAATLLYELTDPAAPELVYTVQGAFGTWRDMKSVGDYIYVTADQGADGLLVIDMSAVGDSITHNFWRPMYDKGSGMQQLSRVHNIYADERYVYLSGLDSDAQRGGILILDTELDPLEPPVAGVASEAYSHDVFVQDTLMYTSEIYNGEFGVYDISDPSTPTRLAVQQTTSDFTHNAWVSADGNFLFTTDEVQDANVDSYDLSDLDNIRRLDAFQPYRPDAAAPTIPHNTHYFNGYLVTSWYEDGVVIIDANKPDNLVEVASYDTWLNASGTGRGFNGCWGVTPFLPSGLVIANDINSGLYVLQPAYVRASYFEGLVIDSLSRLPIPGASVEILGSRPHLDLTGQTGTFKTGIAESGTFDVRVASPGYNTKVVSVDLASGVVTMAEIELSKSIKTGVVVTTDGAAVEGAQVAFYDQETGEAIFVATGADGSFVLEVDRSATYEVYAGKWGYTGASIDDVPYDGGAPITLEVALGYEDDFFADLGWGISGNAQTGRWEIGAPLGTVNGDTGEQSNPDIDADGDLGFTAYVTGNTGIGLGDDDVDSGTTRLESPAMEFGAEGLDTLRISTSYWYYTCCGNGPVNDTLEMVLDNGSDQIVLFRTGSISQGWQELNFTVTADMITFTDDMRFRVEAADRDPGNIVEAGIDAFSAVATEAVVSSLQEVEIAGFAAYPSPFTDLLIIDLPTDQQGRLQVFDLSGRLIADLQADQPQVALSTGIWAPGLYYARWITAGSVSQTLPLVKH